MSKTFTYEKSLPVGLIQTTVNAKLAWPRRGSAPQMSIAQDRHSWNEICKAMRAFKDGDTQPKFIILPELALPRTRLKDFEKLVCSLNVIAFVGVDYNLDHASKQVRNEGLVFIPRGFWRGRPSKGCSRVIFGKTHAAPGEKRELHNLVPPWTFVSDHNVYVFDAERYGRVGISICYDFMDLERAVMYRGRIHHLFILAYNRDLGMFQSLAESLSRTVFCNVVICNTGFYGGSLSVAPYFAAHDRTLFRHNGKVLFTTQVIHLPVVGIADALNGNSETRGSNEKQFKDPPPGITERFNLTCQTVGLNNL